MSSHSLGTSLCGLLLRCATTWISERRSRINGEICGDVRTSEAQVDGGMLTSGRCKRSRRREDRREVLKQVVMAPAFVPRWSRANANPQPRRSRLLNQLRLAGAIDGNCCVEVTAGREAKCIRDSKRLSMINKCGFTGIGLPSGVVGRITYSLTHQENELLYSFGNEVEIDNAGFVFEEDNGDLIIGAWMVGILLQ